MLTEVITELVGLLKDHGMRATADARNINAPCCFVTVTRFDKPTLDAAWRATGEVLAIGRDLGGLADISTLSKFVDDILDALEPEGVAVESIETNQQATPPTGGTLPAVRLTYTLYAERTNHGN
ncbi:MULTISPECIES: hypothetical protein [Corynebacterium]|uniref:DUF3168 domain-containing protein n=1 Tax=Corynebacterium hadale TaxID=2026255 RepID=A0A269PFA4_9CORY|nr:hypothetical protein [Corynebacterium hadale]PAJ70921.1 hypothetical protein CIG21_01695 [Corynebacterium hadale]WKC60819.1 hypothetical protein CHAD_09830 [Corynebacterium hadale]